MQKATALLFFGGLEQLMVHSRERERERDVHVYVATVSERDSIIEPVYSKV